MQIFMIILGVVFILCGISCMFTPLLTTMELGYFFIALLLVYGIARIVKSVSAKEYGLDIALGILSVLLGLAILFIPGLKAMTTGALLYVMAGWFVVQGIISIINAMKRKKSESGSMWIWGICSGVLCLLMGIYSAIHPIVLALTMGLMVGLYFIVSGINMIALSSKTSE